MAGIDMGLGDRTTQRPAWLATSDRLKAALLAYDANGDPHARAAMSSPPGITMGAGSSTVPPAPHAGLTQAFRHSAGTLDAVCRGSGGRTKTYLTDYRRFPVATQGASGGNCSDGEDAIAWRAECVADTSAVAFRVLGASSYRFIVDGQYVSTAATSPVSGGRQYVVLDFGSKAARHIRIEGQLAAALDGIQVAPGDSVSRPTASRLRALFLGDSFTASTGATLPGDGYAQVAADGAGLTAMLSAVGDTGYVADATGTKYKLSQRLVADIDRALAIGSVDIVVVAMGLNDLGKSGIGTAAGGCFDTIRQKCPAAVVLVIGPWDIQAPSAAASGYAACKAAIQGALSGREGFCFIDPQGLGFTKADAAHPNTAGHAVLGQWLVAQMRSRFVD